jgi:hypothetical protein
MGREYALLGREYALLSKVCVLDYPLGLHVGTLDQQYS